MSACKKILGFSLLIALCALPTHANVEASRCSFDPSCLCIEWYGAEGATIEIRCPGGSGNGGGQGGWTTSGDFGGPSAIPEIVDPEGSWEGDGGFGGPGILLGAPLTFEEEIEVGQAQFFADRMIRLDPECKQLLAGSPLTENGEWLLTKLQYRNGKTVSGSPCSKPNVAAFTKYPGEHEPIVYLCDHFYLFDEVGAGQVLIHELLHVAGQSEDGSDSTGPGDAPSSLSIHETGMTACDSF